MSANIENRNGKDSIAFLGSRKDIWHSLGQEMTEGMSIDLWAKEAGLNWEAECMPAYFQNGTEMVQVKDKYHVVRKDTNVSLGFVTQRWKIVQPREVLDWFDKYIKHDDRFQLDVAGCLKSGEIIWATAKYNGDITVGGDVHKARLLMTTGFDGTLATTNKMTMTRVVCNNTLDAALADGGKTCVRTTHSAKFNAAKVGSELSKLAEQVQAYKKMGDAMASKHMADETTKAFFAKLLKIDGKDKVEDLSTRKAGMFNDLVNAYNDTVSEGTEPNTQWCALNAVTRYVDHVRGTRVTEGMNEGDMRFISSQMTTGAAMKAEAVKVLTNDAMIAELMKQPFRPSSRDEDADLKAMLKAPLKTRVDA